MAFWQRWLSGRKSATSSLELFREIFGGYASKSGRAVNATSALDVATVLGCVRVLAEGVAQVPFKVFQEDGKNKLPAKEHPLYYVLFRRPNDWQTSFEYRETLMFHTVLCGNHFSFINRVRGKIVELIPIEPGLVTVKRDNDYRLTYHVRGINGGSAQPFPQESIWHVRGPSWNSWMGLEAVKFAREAIGLAMAIEDQQASFYKNGAHSSGFYSVEGTLNDKQYSDLAKFIKDNYEGPDNAGKTMILDRAAKFVARVMSSVDAQTLESRRMQIEEICRAFRVMPIMIGFSDKAATYASAEQMFLAHLVHTLMPWFERIEQSVDVNLIGRKENIAGVYAKLVAQGFLRGALRDTAAYLKELVFAGIMTRNEGREKLELNPLEGLDEPLTPVNITGNNPDRDPPDPENRPRPY